MENSELEDFFFGRLTVKIFKCSHKYFTSAITEKKVSALNLFAASIYLGLGKLLYQFYVLEVQLLNFLSFGGLILATILFSFMCYFLSISYLEL